MGGVGHFEDTSERRSVCAGRQLVPLTSAPSDPKRTTSPARTCEITPSADCPAGAINGDRIHRSRDPPELDRGQSSSDRKTQPSKNQAAGASAPLQIDNAHLYQARPQRHRRKERADCKISARNGDLHDRPLRSKRPDSKEVTLSEPIEF